MKMSKEDMEQSKDDALQTVKLFEERLKGLEASVSVTKFRLDQFKKTVVALDNMIEAKNGVHNSS